MIWSTVFYVWPQIAGEGVLGKYLHTYQILILYVGLTGIILASSMGGWL